MFGALVEDIGEEPADGPTGPTPGFGTQLITFDQATGFVNGVAWSPSGRQLAFVA